MNTADRIVELELVLYIHCWKAEMKLVAVQSSRAGGDRRTLGGKNPLCKKIKVAVCVFVLNNI